MNRSQERRRPARPRTSILRFALSLTLLGTLALTCIGWAALMVPSLAYEGYQQAGKSSSNNATPRKNDHAAHQRETINR
jgi:hypothetical protein